MNLLHIIGFLGADPENRVTSSGQKLWRMRVATRVRKNGQDDTIWWNITVWGDQFDNIIKYLTKGKPVYIVAEMTKLDIYTDKAGQPQISYEATARSLHFLPGNSENKGEQAAGEGGGYQNRSAPARAAPQNASPQGEYRGQQQAYAAQPQGNGSENPFGEDDPIPF